MSNEQRGESWASRVNGLMAVGGVAVFFAFVPVLGGEAVRALPLLIGVLLIVGGAIVNAIKSRS